METNSLVTKQKVNILLVDDHPENLLALEAVLSSLDYNLVKVLSGEEALKWVLKEEFAVILLDVQMPGVNGFDTAQLIKEREKSKDIPIIFITAISQAVEHVTQGYSVGGIDYVFKPFEPAILIKKVEGLVKIYMTIEKTREQSKLLRLRAGELEEVNQELVDTTQALRNTEALARVIGEVSTDTILTLDQHGIILNVNPAVREMFSYSVEELIGEKVLRLLPEFREAQEGTHAFRQSGLIKKENSGIVETVAKRINGERFPVEISIGEACVNNQSIIIYSICDITERKQIEKERIERYEKLEKLVLDRTLQIRLTHEELKHSEERFRKTFESSPNLMAISSLIDTRYIDVNECWEKHTGYSILEVKNRKLDLIRVAGNTSEKDENLYLLQKHPLRNLRVTYQTKSGKIRDGLLSTEILEIEGEKCLLSVLTDITERLLLEEEMSRLDRLNLIGEMAAGIAHEMRNPMTTVRGFLQMMSARPQHIGSNEFFTLMIEELDRANSIITEFLSLSKSQSLELDKQNLNELIETLFPLIQADAFNSKKDARIELQSIPEFEFDEREIRQMILNLVRNGLEAMSPGCTLTLRTYERSNEIILEVQDQGSGIEPEILQRLGTPFFTTKEKGTGLGLAVCYGIAEKHKARITIDTSPRGTTFIVRFPLNPLDNA